MTAARLSEEFQDVLYAFDEALSDEPYAVTGSTNLYLQGVTDKHPNDIDILTTQDGLDTLIDEFDEYLEERYSDKYPKSRIRYSAFNGRYNKAVFRTVDQDFVSRLLDGGKGVKIDVFGEVEVLMEDEELNLMDSFEPKTERIGGRDIPVLDLEDEARLYRYLGVPEQAEMIDDFLTQD